MQKYYPKDKLGRNSLLYGGLKDIANEYYFNVSDVESYIGYVEITQSSSLVFQGNKGGLSLLSVSSIPSINSSGSVGLNGTVQVTTTSSLITSGSKNSSDSLTLYALDSNTVIGNKNTVNDLVISSVSNIEVIGTSEIPIYDFIGNVSISSNQSIQVQGLKQIVRHTNIYQLSLAYLYGIKNGYDSTLIDQSSSIEVIKGSLSIIVKIISSKVKLDSINNSTSIFESYTSIKTIGSSVNRTVRFGNEYNNKTRRNN